MVAADGEHLDVPGLDLVANKVILYLDMLCPVVKDWILYHQNGAVIVAE